MDVMRGIYDGKVLNLVREARNGHNTEQLRPDTYYILLWLVKALGQSERPRTAPQLATHITTDKIFCG